MLIKSKTKPIVKDRRRWFMLLVFALLSFSNGIGYSNINGILSCASTYYNVNIDKTLIIFNNSNIVFIVFGWLAIPLLDWRLDYSIIGCALLSCASFWMRFLARQSFNAALAGSILNSFAQIIIYPATIYLPEIWFPVEERNLGFGIPFYFNMLGLNFGFLYPVLVLELSGRNCSETMAYTQLVCALISSLTLLASCLFVRNKPKTMQTKRYMQSRRPDLRVSFRNVFCRGSNIFHISVLSLFLGVSWCIFDIMGKL